MVLFTFDLSIAKAAFCCSLSLDAIHKHESCCCPFCITMLIVCTSWFPLVCRFRTYNIQLFSIRCIMCLRSTSCQTPCKLIIISSLRLVVGHGKDTCIMSSPSSLVAIFIGLIFCFGIAFCHPRHSSVSLHGCPLLSFAMGKYPELLELPCMFCFMFLSPYFGNLNLYRPFTFFCFGILSCGSFCSALSTDSSSSSNRSTCCKVNLALSCS